MRRAGAPGRAIVALIAAAAVAASSAVAEAGRRSVSFAPVPLWSGVPIDDDGDGNDAYDRATGLGTSVNCFKARGANVLTVQYSYSRADVLRFYAAVVPKSVTPPPMPSQPALRQLTPRHPMLLWRRTVKTCDEPYALFVAYPK